MKTLLAAGAALAASACGRGPTCERGPVVCDPLPPPLECQNNPNTAQYLDYGHMSFGASWRATSSGFVVAVVLRYQGYEGRDDPVAFPYDPLATGATVGAIERDATILQFELVPADGVSSIDLTIPVDCSGREDALYIRLDVSEPPQDGGYVPWTPNEPAS